MVAAMIDESPDLAVQISGEEIEIQKDAAPHGLAPLLDRLAMRYAALLPTTIFPEAVGDRAHREHDQILRLETAIGRVF